MFFLLMGSVCGNYYIAFILPPLFLLPAKIFPEGMQDCQLLQAYPAAPGETAGKFCLRCQQASESGLRRGQQGVCGESAASIWASWKDRPTPAAGVERVAEGGGTRRPWKRERVGWDRCSQTTGLGLGRALVLEPARLQPRISWRKQSVNGILLLFMTPTCMEVRCFAGASLLLRSFFVFIIIPDV